VAVLTHVSQLEDRRQPTTTLEGWRRFVDADPVDFELLHDDAWSALSEDERIDYNEARIAHHAELVAVTTSAIQEITNEGRLLTLMNQRENGTRRGLIISGGAAKDHCHQAAREISRTAHPPPVSRLRPHPGRLCHRPAQRVAPQAGDGVRPIPWPTTGFLSRERHRHRRRGLSNPDRCPLRHRHSRTAQHQPRDHRR
jgi:hypothetical protein